MATVASVGANLGTLANVTTAANGLANLILATPKTIIGYQPKNAPNAIAGTTVAQPAAIVFHYEGEQSVTIESDITDHYIEDNTAINDHIALHPEVVTTHGFIGELNDLAPNAAFQILQQAAAVLTTISGYTPSLSVTALNAYNEAIFVYNTAIALKNAAVAAWSTITASTGNSGQAIINGNSTTLNSRGGVIATNQNKQQIVFQQFYGYWKARTLFTIQTPWAVFDNMAIKTCRPIQDAETNVITDFEVTFKIIRYASTITEDELNPFDQSAYQNRLSAQGSALQDNGVLPAQGTNVAFPLSASVA